ncbi:MAG: SAM-dependent methyltransferase [Pseudomonadota bacterium]
MDPSNTTLKSRLTSMINSAGPISVATYMDLCLHDRRHGYYATRPGLGRDFITAPEVSQIFGELIGLWAAHQWQDMGEPTAFALIEIGPGRGTLMADAIRAAETVPGFKKAVSLYFVESSPVLQAHVSERFSPLNPTVLDSLEQSPKSLPFVLIANEWLDCLPVQQYVRVGQAWHERVIGLNADGSLVFGLNPEALSADLAPDPSLDAIEIQPGLRTVCETLRGMFDQAQGRALFIDYGATTPPQDTLRSFQSGRQIDPLAAPGASDLTCDVDFGRLLRLLQEHGLQSDGVHTQGAFLLSLGAEARLNQLAKQNPKTADALYQSVKTLIDPEQMGARFLCITVRNGLS